MSRRPHARAVTLLTGICLLALLCCWTFTLTAQAQQRGRGGKSVNVLIAFKQAAGPQERRVVEAAGGTVRRSFQIVPAVAATVPEAALAGLSRNPRVQVIEVDGQFHAIAAALDHTSAPQLSPEQAQAELDAVWGVRRIGAGAVQLDGGNRGGRVRLAVIDSGIDHVKHAQEFPDYIYAGGWDFVNNDADPRDDNGHGTHVAGTVAAARNGMGVVGVAPEVELYVLKVLGPTGSGSFSSVIAALEWCVANNIDVTNNSYGSNTDPGSIVRLAFDNAYAAGVLHVAAAGNAGKPSAKGNNVGYPARYGSVMAVAATTIQDGRASYSSTGPDVELAAPGSSIYSTTLGGGFGSLSGTSMASPHVAGAAALVIHALRDANDAALLAGDIDESAHASAQSSVNVTARQVLVGTAEDLGAAGHDEQFGHGLVDAEAAVLVANAATPGDGGGGDGGDGGDEPAQNVASIDSIAYSVSGPKPDPTRDLLITLTLLDEVNQPVANATVSITASVDGIAYGTGSGTTGTNGQVAFKLTRAPAGTWTTAVNSVEGSVTWDGVTPPNSYSK